MFRRRLTVALTLGATLVAITACSSTTSGTGSAAGGISAPSMPAPAKLADTVKASALAASAVHVKGNEKDGTDNTSLDLQLNKDGSASGTLTDNGTTIPLVSTGKVIYVQFTNAMETAGGLDPAGAQGKSLLNKWVPSTSSMMSGEVDSIKPATDYNTFIPQLFDALDGGDAPKDSGTGTTDGYPVHHYTFSDGSTADISTASPHYLIRMSDKASGTLDFTGWDKPVAVTVPAAADTYQGS